MYKLILIALCIILYCSCSDKGQIKVDLSKELNSIDLLPKRKLTSGCTIRFYGEIDCDIRIGVISGKNLEFKAGKVNFTQKYESYKEGKKLNIYSKNCTENSNLIISYSFTTGYFGQKK